MFAHSKTTIAAVTLLASTMAFIVSMLWGIWTLDVTAFKVLLTSAVLITLSGVYMANNEDDMV